MPLNLEQKKAVVEEVAEVAQRASAAIAADYRGLTVSEMTALRRQAREANVHLRVVRNTLARRAFEGTDLACMSDGLVGPLVLAFSQDGPGDAARVISDFAKGNEKLQVKLVAAGGKLLDASAIGALANLPTREEALARLLGSMKAPVGQLARTLQETVGKLVRTVAAVRDQKQAA